MAFLATTVGAICASAVIALIYLYLDPSRIPIEVAMTAGIAYLVGLPIAVYVIRLTSRVGAAERARIEAEIRQNESELARMEAERANRSAQAADRMRVEFLGKMSHEVRTPINGVLGMAEVLKQTKLADDQKYYVDMIAESGQSLLAMINDVLELASFEADRLTLRQDRFDPRRLFADVAGRIVPARRSETVEFRLTVAPETPAALIGDQARLEQVAANLIDNALRFTEKGLVETKVSVVGTGDDAMLRLEVTDTGPGVSDEDRQAIFEVFHQVDGSPSRIHQGPGLGLAIVASIAAAMKGDVAVESEPGRGATFRFEAPIAIAPEGEAAPLEGARVVVASSDPEWGERVAAALAGAGADAMSSAGFEASEKALRARAFAAAVVDARAAPADIVSKIGEAAATAETPALIVGGGGSGAAGAARLPADAAPGAVVDAVVRELRASAYAAAV
ncbi:MAG: ATP-binding protein [Pseudomonadota bacterium]